MPNGFHILCQVPKFKYRIWRWFGYYDEEDLQWAPVTIQGTLLYQKGARIPFAVFPNMSSAREFVKKAQAPKRETLVGEEEEPRGKQRSI